jgi:hypothetical protein
MSKKKNSEPRERYRAEWLGQPLTAEEARAKGKAGGIKSGQVRKEKKTLRETMKLLLKEQFKFNNPVTDEFTSGDGYAMWCAQVTAGALKGDRKCLEYLRDIIGENPSTKVVGAEEEPLRKVEIEFVDASKRTKKETDPKIVGEQSPTVSDES